MKNWKTALIGLLLGTGTILQPVIESQDINLMTILKAFGIALLGLVAKDFDKSGTN